MAFAMGKEESLNPAKFLGNGPWLYGPNQINGLCFKLSHSFVCQLSAIVFQCLA